MYDPLEAMKQKAESRVTDMAPIPPDPWARSKNIAAFITFSLMIFMVAAIFWVVFLEKPALMYDNLPFKVVSESKIFHPGDNVPLEIKRCNNLTHTLVYDLTRTLKNVVSQESIVLESTKVAAAPGCHTSISHIHNLPIQLDPGTYIISGVATVPGTINDRVIEFYSEPFSVVPPTVKILVTPN